MVTPAFVFLREDGETNSAAVARCAEEALAAGPMGNRNDGDRYQSFLEWTWGNGVALRTVKTSCAIFAGACCIAAGVTERKGWPKARAITTWLGLGGFSGATWLPASNALVILRGDILYWCGGSTRTWHAATNGHVGIALEGHGRRFRTAEGGGGDGTLCRMSDGLKDISASAGRPLRGVWRPDRLVSVDADTLPAPPPETLT